MNLKKIGLSLLANMIFAWIDSSFDIFVEEDLNDILSQIGGVNEKNIKIITNGISASVAMLVSRIIEEKIGKYTEVIDSPYLPAIGVLLGSIIIFFLHVAVYKPLKKTPKKSK